MAPLFISTPLEEEAEEVPFFSLRLGERAEEDGQRAMSCDATSSADI